MEVQEQTMATTATAAAMIANKNHLDKPGNPSTATSSALKLNAQHFHCPIQNSYVVWYL